MITQIVEVVDTQAGYMTVKPQQQGCDSCSSGTCGVNNIARVFGGRRHLLKLVNDDGYKPGELAELSLDEATYLRSVILQYLLPLVSMILLVMLVSFLSRELVVQLTAAIAGISAGVYIARYLIKHNEHRLSGKHLQVRRLA